MVDRFTIAGIVFAICLSGIPAGAQDSAASNPQVFVGAPLPLVRAPSTSAERVAESLALPADARSSAPPQLLIAPPEAVEPKAPIERGIAAANVSPASLPAR